jgi:hypothetical protein
MLGCFSLLLKLAEVQDLRLAEFGKVLIELHNCLRPFPDKVIVQGSDAESFDGLSDNLVIRNFWRLGF